MDGGTGSGAIPSESFYACSCTSSSPGGALPILLALGVRMADALGSLITDAERASRLAEAAYEHVRSGYAPEARVRRLIGIYRGLLAETGSVKR